MAVLNQTTDLLTQILNALGAGVPGVGNATAANQATQITAADAANTLLDTIRISNANNLINLNEINVRLQAIVEGNTYTSLIEGDSVVTSFEEDTAPLLASAIQGFLNSTNMYFVSCTSYGLFKGSVIIHCATVVTKLPPV